MEGQENQQTFAQEFVGKEPVTPVVSGTEGAPKVEQTTVQAAAGAPAGTPQTPNAFDAYFDRFKKRLPDDYAYPEELKTGKDKEGKEIPIEDRMDMLLGIALNEAPYHENPEIDGFINNLVAASGDPEFRISEFVKQNYERYASNLDDKGLVMRSYKEAYGKSDKNPNGMSDEDITAEVENLSKLALKREAEAIRGNMAKQAAVQAQQMMGQYEKKATEQTKKANEDTKALTDKYLKSIGENNIIEGLTFPKEVLEKFKGDVPKLMEFKVVKDNQGNISVTNEAWEIMTGILSDPATSYAFLPYLWAFKNNQLTGYTTSVKEEIKKKIEEKLGVAPGVSGASAGRPSEFNPKDFAAGK